MTTATKRADIVSVNQGTIVTFSAHTKAGVEWLRDNLDGATVCEHRYAYDILAGMIDDGLSVMDGPSGRFGSK